MKAPNFVGRAKPRTCFLHIGMAKSGSTAIQAALRNYQSDTAVYGKFSTESENHGTFLATTFSDEPWDSGANSLLAGNSKELGWRMQEAYRRELDQAVKTESRDLILSGECLTNRYGDKVARRASEFFETAYDRLQIICYLRPPSGFIPSRIQQKLRKFAPDTFDWSGGFPTYREAIEQWTAKVSQTSLTIRPFARDYFTEGSVVADFCEIVGIERQADKAANPSISFEALSIIFAQRLLGAENTHPEPFDLLANRAVTRKLRRYGTHRLRMSQTALDTALDQMKEDINWAVDILPMSQADAKAFLASQPPMTSKDVELDVPQDLLKYAPKHLEYVQSLNPDFVPKGCDDLDRLVQCLDHLRDKIAASLMIAFELADDLMRERQQKGLGPAPIGELAFTHKTRLKALHNLDYADLEILNARELLGLFTQFEIKNGHISYASW